MLKNAYLLAKIGADTAENEQPSAEFLPIGRRVAAPNGQFNVAFEALDHRGRGRDRGLSQTLSACLSLGCERNSNDGIQKTEFVEL